MVVCSEGPHLQQLPLTLPLELDVALLVRGRQLPLVVLELLQLLQLRVPAGGGGKQMAKGDEEAVGGTCTQAHYACRASTTSTHTHKVYIHTCIDIRTPIHPLIQ